MNDIAAVRQGVDRLLLGDLQPMLGLLADDVAFTVAVGGDAPEYVEQSGKQPVVDYFMGLGGLVTFWQMDYTARGDQLIAWGKESFTIERCEIEGGCEFALVFDVSEGMITRFLVLEDLPSFIRAGGSLVELSSRDWAEAQPSTNFFNPSSIIPQFDSEWARASSVGLLSWVSETRVRSPSADN
jgi:hypothetical protein